MSDRLEEPNEPTEAMNDEHCNPISGRRPPKMTAAILTYAKDKSSFTPSGFLAECRGHWGERSVKSRLNEMVKLGMLVRVSRGKQALRTESHYSLTSQELKIIANKI